MSVDKVSLWLNIVLLLGSANPVSPASFKFNNVKCEIHDRTFVRMDLCKLSVVRRGVVSLNVFVRILKSPVTNASVNVALYKRGNVYRPYLFNKSADVCAYFAHRKKYPVLHAIFSTFAKNTNLNHTCPYSDAIILKDFELEERIFELLPMPNGQYLFKIMVFGYNDLKYSVQVFFTRTD